MVRRVFVQKERWSEKELFWLEGTLVRRCVVPKGRWSEGALVQGIVRVFDTIA